MMGGVRKSMGLLAIGALVIGVEAATISNLSVYSQEVIEIEYEPITQIVEMKEAAGNREEVVRTHDVRLISYEDEDLIKTVAMAEGANQGEDGMWLIMSVVVNRKNSTKYPDSFKGVIFQESQFASVADGNFDKVSGFTEECQKAFDRINAGEIAPAIVAFERKESHELDKYFNFAFEYRDHRFYTEKE